MLNEYFTTAEFDQQLERARALAMGSQAPYMVAEIDSGDDRELIAVPLDYADTGEFEAFDGEILAIAYPGGDVECYCQQDRGDVDALAAALVDVAHNGLHQVGKAVR